MSTRRIALSAVVVLIVAGGVCGEYVTIEPAAIWPDVDGQHINAHCGGFIKVGQKYYWFGEDRTQRPTQRISCYVSQDLQQWKFVRFVITPQTDPDVAAAHLERPKVIYNDSTGRYVMWMHKEEVGRGYDAAKCAVASCETVDGAYTWHRSFRPEGNMSRDCTLFRDDDGSAYFISAANDNADMVIYRLTDDYLKVAEQVATIFPGQYREAPAVFKRDGRYYLITSFCTGIKPNPQYYTTAPAIAGPWRPYRRLCSDLTWNTYYSQSTFVLPVEGSEATTYVYCGDRWKIPLSDMRYVWLPLEFEANGDISPMMWYDSWRIDADSGKCRHPDGPAPRQDNIAVACDVTADYNRTGEMFNYGHFAGHPPSAANDGDRSTAWSTKDNLPHYWQLDLQGRYDLSGTQIMFFREGVNRYKVEVSTDRAEWKLVVNKTDSDSRRRVQTDRLSVAGTRYVRVTWTGTDNGYTWPGICEFKALTDSGDVAKGKPATADDWQADTDCTKAVDGDFSTAWTIDNDTAGHWLKVDLGGKFNLSGCRILWEAPGFWYQYRVEVSPDGSDWCAAVDQSDNTEVNWLAEHKFEARQMRYVRLELVGYDDSGGGPRRAMGCWPGVREFELFGVKSPGPRNQDESGE